MRKKIKIDIGWFVTVVLLITSTCYANANFLRPGEVSSLNENNWRVSGAIKTMASYTAPANVVLTNTGQNILSGFVSRYVLVNNTTQTIAFTNTTPNFSNVPLGNYSAYAVNYNSALASPNLAIGTAFSAIGGECVNTSSAFQVLVTSGTVACLPATAGVGTVSAVASGQNTAPGFTTRYVLTNAAGVIQSSNTTGSFLTPGSIGEYRIYAVNFSTTGTQPSFTNGGNISAIGGDCTDVSDPKCFNVSLAPCTPPTVSNVTASPATITAGQSSVLSATCSAGSTLTWAHGTNTTVSPAATTTYTAVCTVSGMPNCVSTKAVTVTVTPANPGTCTPVQGGGAMVATVSGNNTSAGFTTVYVMTNASGVIQSSQISGQFTAPNVTAEYRIYAVNFEVAAGAPNVTAGTNINAIGGGCVDTSAPKCFDVTATQSCVLPTISNVTASPATITAGQSSVLSATCSTGSTLTWAHGTNTTVSPAATTTYTAICTVNGMPNCVSTQAVTVTVNPVTCTPPTISNVTASPATITAGQSSVLSATCSTGSTLTWAHGTNTTVSPAATTTYTAICTVNGMPNCVSTKTVTVTVTPTSLVCTNVTGGSTISATASGHTTGAGFATQYVLTNATGVILNSNTSGSFTAPNTAGEVRIYAVNYSTSGVQPVFTNGLNISSVSGDCVDVSDIPKCFNVTPATVTCIVATAGSSISATTSGNNTSAGFTTVYILTDVSGVIRATSSTGSFTAPLVAGEYRIYAVNYSGTAPNLSSGTNLSAIGGDCVDVSDSYKCYTVTACPSPNCLTVTVTRIR